MLALLAAAATFFASLSSISVRPFPFAANLADDEEYVDLAGSESSEDEGPAGSDDEAPPSVGRVAAAAMLYKGWAGVTTCVPASSQRRSPGSATAEPFSETWPRQTPTLASDSLLYAERPAPQPAQGGGGSFPEAACGA